MIAIFGILYVMLFIFYCVAAAFIAFHIIKYSLNKSVMALTLGIFFTVFGALLFANIMLFLSMRWDQVFSNIMP